MSEIEKLKSENEKLKETLRFYENEKNYETELFYSARVMDDKGVSARAVLKEVGEE